MIDESKVTPFSLWRHVKTNSYYIVLGIALCSTNGEREGEERSVLYWSLTYNGLRYREISEFLDGRFERVDDVESVKERIT